MANHFVKSFSSNNESNISGPAASSSMMGDSSGYALNLSPDTHGHPVETLSGMALMLAEWSLVGRVFGHSGKLFGLSNKGLKHLGKHLGDFQKLDPGFTLNSQIDLGMQIASNTRNFVNNVNGSLGYEAMVMIGNSLVRVRAVVNASGNLRSVYIVTK